MMFLSILIWCFNKYLAFWAAVVLLLSGTYSNAFKDLFALPRPNVEGVILPGGYGLPSGHTLTATTLWRYLAVHIRARLFWVWTGVVVTLVGVSRIILGYHFPRDVITGIALGVIFLLIFLSVEARFHKRNQQTLGIGTQFLISTAIPLVLFFLFPGDDAPLLMGFLLEASWGYILERHWIRMKPQSPFFNQFIKIIMGLAGLFGIAMGLSEWLPSTVPALRFIRYALAGLWVVFLAPALFVKWGFSPREHSCRIRVRYPLLLQSKDEGLVP